MSAGDCSTVLRRFTGPVAEELAILCRPEDRARDAARQADAAYRALADALSAQRASFADVATETLFLRDIRRDLPVVLAARERVLSELGRVADAPLPAFLEQAPIDERAAFELLATAVVPLDRAVASVRDVRADTTCDCEGCAKSGARLLRLGDQLSLHTTNLYGAGGDATAQVREMFHSAERLLEREGMTFRDVVRTWIHLRDIDRDYDALNAARRDFFRERGIERRPASTGVGGGPLPDRHHFSLSVHAVKSSHPLEVARMSTPLLNEAWSYGADFTRGLRVHEANRVTLHVSGTASIDEEGRTIHTGDFPAQAERMLDNLASLLAGQGASFGDLLSGILYLKRPSDAAELRSLCRRRGFEGFPCAVVESTLCRPDLLCEAEAVALLSPTPAGA